MFYFFIILLGLICGSAINAFVYRIHEGKNYISGRSMCPKCKHVLSWYELIPVFSFILQRGRCLTCHKKISWQYPLVEIATAVLFFILGGKFLSPETFVNLNAVNFIYLIGYFVITLFLVVIFVYDFKYYLILDKITFPAMAFAFIWNMLTDFSYFSFKNLILAALIGGGFFLLQFIISKGRWIGGGDIRLGLLIGLILGFPGVLVALMLAYFIGAGLAIFMLLLKKKQWGSQVPFGTFLSLGTFIALVWQYEIINWYFLLIF